jgi:hypothetical protein
MNTRYLRAELHSPSSNKNSNAFKPTPAGGDQRAIHFINPAANQGRILQPQPLLRSIPIKSGVLNSWKEIATYLGRGVRTVQRWEAELHLPVHRPRGKTRSAVVAFRQELDEWLQCTPSHGDSKEIGSALLDIAHDMQALARQLFASANFQTQSEREKLVEAAGTIVQRLNLLMDGNSGSTNFDRNSSSQGRCAMKEN